MDTRMPRRPLASALPIVALLLLMSGPLDGQAAAGADGTIVIAVRHAERADDGGDATRDPALSDIGGERARCLAHTLADAGLTRVFSTDYIRTRSTARPVAEALGLEVEPYDPRALDTFAQDLRDAGGVILVVGHSNTTPSLVEALNGDPVAPIEEDEYDRLYTVFLTGDGARSTLTRYCPTG